MHGARQAFNPPFVHSIDVAVPPWAPRQLGRLLALARGDGQVALYDVDHVDRTTPRKGTKKRVSTSPITVQMTSDSWIFSLCQLVPG